MFAGGGGAEALENALTLRLGTAGLRADLSAQEAKAFAMREMGRSDPLAALRSTRLFFAVLLTPQRPVLLPDIQ